ncbi:hypothetical protein ABWL24_26090, partial [Priestia megaterium]
KMNFFQFSLLCCLTNKARAMTPIMSVSHTIGLLHPVSSPAKSIMSAIRMTRINDESFGKLEYKNNFWRGKTTIKMFGVEKEILLSVDAYENTDFSHVQKEAFLNFIQNMENIMNKAEKHIYDYYMENYEEYREMIANKSEADQVVPNIHSVLDLKKLVEPTELIVRRVRKNGKRRLGLLCDVSWDIENGIGIKMEDEGVEEVGYQDIVL